jgi:hypothetical protein
MLPTFKSRISIAEPEDEEQKFITGDLGWR